MSILNSIPTGEYSTVELNKITAQKTGQIKNQYALNATDFASIPAQNGMLLVVNEYAETIDLPADATSYVYLHASEEKDYEGLGRNKVAVNVGEMLPMMYKLSKGDVFETNAFEWDSATYANIAAVVAAISSSAVFGTPQANGLIRLAATAAGTETVLLKVKEAVTLPNGNSGLKFVVAKVNDNA